MRVLSLEDYEASVAENTNVENQPAEVVSEITEPVTTPVAEEPVENAMSVEELEEQQDEMISTGTDETETELLVSNSEEQNNFNEEEKATLAVESLAEFAALTKNLIDTNRCSLESLALIRTGVAPHLATLNVKPLTLATESDKSINELHQAALEGFWNNLFQDWVLFYKHAINATTDLFKTKEEQVAKYKSSLEEAQGEWKNKSYKLKQHSQDVSLDRLWYYFSNKGGQVAKPADELVHEAELSSYVLTHYTDSILSELDKLTSILSSGKVTNAETAATLAKKIESLKTPVELFDKKFTNKSYLNVSQLAIETGTKRTAVVVENAHLDRLAELATPVCVSLSGSISHNALKTASGALDVAGVATGYLNPAIKAVRAAKTVANAGNIARFMLGKNLVVPNADVDKMLKSANTMLDSANAYFNSSNKFASSVDKFTKAINKYTETSTESAEVFKIFTQINQISKNYINAYKRTGVEIAAHSIKGAKYTAYLVKRINWNAK